MPEAVYRMLTLLCGLVVNLPVGTNLGLLHLLWMLRMLVSGRLLASRGAVIPGLDACGLSRRAVRRAWAAVGTDHWTSERLLERWTRQMRAEGCWHVRTHGGYHPVPVDLTGFWRPRRQGCPTMHYSAEAGKALPAIPVGLVARVGAVGGKRVPLPLALVPAPPTVQRLPVLALLAGRSWPTRPPPRRPLPPASGTAGPSRQRGGCVASWRRSPFRRPSRCRRACAQNGRRPVTCAPATGGNAAHVRGLQRARLPDRVVPR